MTPEIDEENLVSSKMYINLQFFFKNYHSNISFDADKKFDIKIEKSQDIPPGCSCHLIMVGKIYPTECELFGKSCTPINPIGPCMVSME